MCFSRIRAIAGLLAWSMVWICPTEALGQTAAMLEQLQKLHERATAPDVVLTAGDVKQIADRLREWKLDPEKLSREDRVRLGRVEVHIALAKGDAKAGYERAVALLGEYPEEHSVQETAYLAAYTAGDAKLGTEMLKEISKGATGEQRRQNSMRRRWLRGVGKPAPDVEIVTEDMTGYKTTRRGDRVLLIDFWNVAQSKEDDTSTLLSGLSKDYQYDTHLEMVGVNADSEDKLEEAKEFAKAGGYTWKQKYEYTALKAPITHEAFHAGPPPWQVLIDIYGYVRAIGSLREPGFQYAVRATVAEARGDHECVLPRTRDGTQPELASAKIKPIDKKTTKEQGGELRSDPDAAAKLNLARTYMKTGKRTDAKRLFQEIVRDFPGTFEAKEAQEYLDSFP